MNKRVSLVFAVLVVALGGCGLLKKAEPINQTHTGTIEQGDLVIEEDNSLYDDYELDVEEGWTITATMMSDAFDTYLILVAPDGSRAAYNDDDASVGGSGTNSKVTFRVPSSGKYHLYANAYQAGQSGPYSLSVQAGPAQ